VAPTGRIATPSVALEHPIVPEGTDERERAMSATGATIQRRGVHVPIWPILALLVLTVATGITLRVLNDVRPTARVTTVDQTATTDSQVGHPAPREALRPTMIGVIGVSAYEASGASVRELPAAPFHAEGRAHEVVFGTDEAPAAPTKVEGFRDCLGCGGRR
jgi:hypothetical protein